MVRFLHTDNFIKAHNHGNVVAMLWQCFMFFNFKMWVPWKWTTEWSLTIGFKRIATFFFFKILFEKTIFFTQFFYNETRFFQHFPSFFGHFFGRLHHFHHGLDHFVSTISLSKTWFPSYFWHVVGLLHGFRPSRCHRVSCRTSLAQRIPGTVCRPSLRNGRVQVLGPSSWAIYHYDIVSVMVCWKRKYYELW